MGALQLQILRILWRGPASVAEVHSQLAAEADLALTTVATMLRKMEARGLVTHSEEGRRFVYAAAVRESEVAADLASDVLDRVFDGRLADLVQHLLTSREVDPAELDEIERMVRARRRKSP